MTLLLAFLVGMFALGLLPRKRPPALWAIVLAACVLVSVGYFFFGQI